MKHVFGPVPSRRLGFSLGVDPLVPKTCSMDCVYCELGPTTDKTIARKAYVDVDAVLRELEPRLTNASRVDYVTISGSGEPTLSSELGELITGIRKVTEVPLAILTNSSLLSDDDVAAQCARADVVLPSLDAVTEAAFAKVTRPHESLAASGIMSGLSEFRRRYKGELWLEIVFVRGMNDSPTEVSRLARAVVALDPERVHVNTVVRPPSESSALPVDDRSLHAITERLGRRAEIIARPRAELQSAVGDDAADVVMAIASRRPVTVLDVTRALGTSQAEAAKILAAMETSGLVVVVRHGERVYYRSNCPEGGER